MASKPIQFTANEKDMIIVGLSLAIARSERGADDPRNSEDIRQVYVKNREAQKALAIRIDAEA